MISTARTGPYPHGAGLVILRCAGGVYFSLAPTRRGCKLQSFGRQTEIWRWLLGPERKTSLWLFSFAMPRGSHRHHRRISELNGLFLAHVRIGSVIREQRPAIATTRTTGCSLNAGWNTCAFSRAVGERVRITRKLGRANGQTTPSIRFQLALKELRWSSRPRPVNRLQATGEPRRVMRGGRKVNAWLQRTGQTRPVATQGRLSPSPKNRVPAQYAFLFLLFCFPSLPTLNPRIQ